MQIPSMNIFPIDQSSSVIEDLTIRDSFRRVHCVVVVQLLCGS